MPTYDYKSKYERAVVANMERRGIPFEYEADKIHFVKQCVYNPDFKIGNLYVEAKGLFEASDRGKHLLIRKQHPHIDIRFLFMNARVKLSKRTNTSYGQWATENGFIWAEGIEIPAEWIAEALKGKPNKHGR